MEPLDFKRLYDIVTERGGFNAVCARQEWSGIYDKMKIAHKSTSGAWNIRERYKRSPLGPSAPALLFGPHASFLSRSLSGTCFRWKQNILSAKAENQRQRGLQGENGLPLRRLRSLRRKM